jgi:hypothetical protein
MVYVIGKSGNPLMPCKPARAKHLLRDSEARIVSMEPFTIQLTIATSEQVQPVTVGVDLGASTVGLAAVGNGKALYQGEIDLRTDIKKRMESRVMYRRSRRGRKCRYRSPRFKNRASSRRAGIRQPSIKSRSDTTIKAVRRIAAFLPVSNIRVEVGQFDTQAMRAGRKLPGWAYQRGAQYGFENVKMYVRTRDKYTCRYCGKKSPSRLEVDHIIPRSRGGTDRPDNLVASCHDCNQRKGNLTATEWGYQKIQQGVRPTLKAAAHTQQGKNATLTGLGEVAPVDITYGFITKIDRQKMSLPKTHYYDAVAIASGGQVVILLPWYEKLKAVSKGARQQRRGRHSQMVARMPYEVFGYRMWDKVQLPDGRVGFVGARRKTGSFKIKDIFGVAITNITYKKLRLIRRATTLASVITKIAQP